VFEVGGVIDLERKDIRIDEPFLTIAGQTAPSPGITLIRGGIDLATHDVVVRHLHVRSGTAGAPKGGGYEPDAFTTITGAHDVIVDHCSMTWAIDENLSASGTRFVGQTPDEWRNAVSHRITFSHNIIAEGLRRATHSKGEHSKGSLIHDNVTDILIVGNLYAHNHERNPLFKGGVQGVVANNLIYDPGPRAVHYNLIEEEWAGHAYLTGRMTLVGNVLRAGPSTPEPLALFELGGSGDVELYADDNIAVDRIGRPLPKLGRYTTFEREDHRAEVAAAAARGRDAAARERSPGRRDPATSALAPGIATAIDRRIVADTHRRPRRDHRQRGSGGRLSAPRGDARRVRARGLGSRHHGAKRPFPPRVPPK
jgi:hypothetical protein